MKTREETDQGSFDTAKKRNARHFEQKLKHAAYEADDVWEDQDYDTKEVFHRNKKPRGD